MEFVEGGDLGADEAFGEVGVDLAGGLDGGGVPFQVPASDLGLAGCEECDNADGVIGRADDPIAPQFGHSQVRHERRSLFLVELGEVKFELGVDGQGIGGKCAREEGIASP